jgi:predicted 3-demethylubiquinone-9 3-methyltransferase (glyoxalase superfamily)
MSSGAGQIHMSKITMQKISPSLWLDNQAEEAVNFYTSIFKNSKIIDVAHYGEAGAKVSVRLAKR